MSLQILVAAQVLVADMSRELLFQMNVIPALSRLLVVCIFQVHDRRAKEKEGRDGLLEAG